MVVNEESLQSEVEVVEAHNYRQGARKKSPPANASGLGNLGRAAISRGS